MSDQRKAVIKNADMEDKMQQDAVDIASKALSEYNIEKVCWLLRSLQAVPTRFVVVDVLCALVLIASVLLIVHSVWLCYTTLLLGRGGVHQEGIRSAV